VTVRSAVPTFLVDDVAATARWYSDHLGFELAGFFPSVEPYAYASIQRDAAEIMLLNLAGYQKPDMTALRPAGVWDAYLRTDGVRAVFETVRGQPFIRAELVHRPYNDWEFEVLDPNGYILVFGGSE
jgi:catechol 2,3-dioxygenase-like lactoylglutathione lyase family enzyme